MCWQAEAALGNTSAELGGHPKKDTVNSLWMPLGNSQETELSLYDIKEGLATGQTSLPSGFELERGVCVCWRILCSHFSVPSCLSTPPPHAGWRLFDDSTVTTVDESQVVTRYAYVLFYRRRNSPVERPPRGPPHPTDPRAELAPSTEAAASQVRAQLGRSRGCWWFFFKVSLHLDASH